MGLLTDILSRTDAVKRRLGGLLADPAAEAGRLVGNDAEFGAAPSLPYQTQQAMGYTGSVFPGVRQYGMGLLNQQRREQIYPAATQIALMAPIVRGFHGSGRDISNFSLDAEKTTGGSLNKYGVSMSPDPKVASRYATDFNQTGGVVYPVQADLNKTLRLTASEFNSLQKLTGKIDRGEPLTELEDIGLESLLGKAGIKYQGQHPISALKQAGYDSIAGDAGRYGAAEPEYLIFDPNAVKFSLPQK